MVEFNDSCKIKGTCHVMLFGPDGRLKDERIVENLVVDAGKSHIADQMASTHDEAEMGYMAIGTGTTSPTSSDTTLESELDRNALTSRTQLTGSDANKVKYVAEWGAGDGTGAITEAGIFNASSGGTMLCRATFSTINKGSNDTLTINWTVTYG